MRHITLKEKTTEVKGTQKYSTKSLSTRFLSRIFLLYWLKYRRQFGWRHTGVLLFPSVHFARFSPTKTTTFTTSFICYDEELNCWFFASSFHITRKHKIYSSTLSSIILLDKFGFPHMILVSTVVLIKLFFVKP